MIPKIPIKYLENDLYSIVASNNNNASIMSMDLNYSSPPTQPSSNFYNTSYMQTISPNVMTKNILIDSQIVIETNYTSGIDQNLEGMFRYIKNELNRDFYSKITPLGEKHRMEDINWDIDISKIKQQGKDIPKTIWAKLNNSINYIANKNRIGPANFLVSNSKTFEYIFSYLKDELLQYTPEGRLQIGNVTFTVDDSVEDDFILLGRKNKLDTAGVHCLIKTDIDNNIDIYEEANTYRRTFILNYKMFDIGSNPHYQYLKLNTQTISYYRNKKLQKINNSQL